MFIVHRGRCKLPKGRILTNCQSVFRPIANDGGGGGWLVGFFPINTSNPKGTSLRFHLRKVAFQLCWIHVIFMPEADFYIATISSFLSRRWGLSSLNRIDKVIISCSNVYWPWFGQAKPDKWVYQTRLCYRVLVFARHSWRDSRCRWSLQFCAVSCSSLLRISRLYVPIILVIVKLAEKQRVDSKKSGGLSCIDIELMTENTSLMGRKKAKQTSARGNRQGQLGK